MVICTSSPSPSFNTDTNKRQLDKTILLHSEIFRERIYPEIPPSRENWDNLSGEEKASDVTFEECRKICGGIPSCSQFSFKDEKCYVGKGPRLGLPSLNVRSGWMMDRIKKMMVEAPYCKQPEFG